MSFSDVNFDDPVVEDSRIRILDRYLTQEQTKNHRILGLLRAVEGWEFVSYIKFINGKGRCQVSGTRLVNAVEIYNPFVGERGLVLIVSKSIVLGYTNLTLRDLPRRTRGRTRVIDLGDRRVRDVWPDISKPITKERLEELSRIEDSMLGHFDLDMTEADRPIN